MILTRWRPDHVKLFSQSQGEDEAPFENTCYSCPEIICEQGDFKDRSLKVKFITLVTCPLINILNKWVRGRDPWCGNYLCGPTKKLWSNVVVMWPSHLITTWCPKCCCAVMNYITKAQDQITYEGSDYTSNDIGLQNSSRFTFWY